MWQLDPQAFFFLFFRFLFFFLPFFFFFLRNQVHRVEQDQAKSDDPDLESLHGLCCEDDRIRLTGQSQHCPCDHGVREFPAVFIKKITRESLLPSHTLTHTHSHAASSFTRSSRSITASKKCSTCTAASAIAS